MHGASRVLPPCSFIGEHVSHDSTLELLPIEVQAWWPLAPDSPTTRRRHTQETHWFHRQLFVLLQFPAGTVFEVVEHDGALRIAFVPSAMHGAIDETDAQFGICARRLTTHAFREQLLD